MTQKRLVVCLPGKRANQELVWKKLFIGNGLADQTDICAQFNAPVGRSRDNIDNLPADWPAARIDELKSLMRERVASVLDRQWFPKVPTYGMIDYEPRTYAPDGSVSGHWMHDKLRHGFDHDDTRFLNALLDAAREEAPELAYSFYTLPRLTRGFVTAQDCRNAKTAEPFARNFDWNWLHAYGHGNDELDFITQASFPELIARYREQDELLTVMNSKPNIPWIWPKSVRGNDTSVNYHAVTIGTLGRQGNDTLGIWLDLNHQSYSYSQALRLDAMMPYIKNFLEA